MDRQSFTRGFSPLECNARARRLDVITHTLASIIECYGNLVLGIVFALLDRAQHSDRLSPFTTRIDFSEMFECEGGTEFRFDIYEVTLPSWMSAPSFFNKWNETYYDLLDFGCSVDWDEDCWDGLRLVYEHDFDMFLAAIYLLRRDVRTESRKIAKDWLNNWLSSRPTSIPAQWLPPLDWGNRWDLTCREALRLRKTYPRNLPGQYLLLDPLTDGVDCDALRSAMDALMCLEKLDAHHDEINPEDLDLLAEMG